MSGVGLYSVVEHEDNLLETLFEFGMTSMIYCNTVSQRNFISIHFHTCISVEILCLFTKVLNFSNHIRSVELFYEYFVVF